MKYKLLGPISPPYPLFSPFSSPLPYSLSLSLSPSLSLSLPFLSLVGGESFLHREIFPVGQAGDLEPGFRPRERR